jgi:hypothetical protein
VIVWAIRDEVNDAGSGLCKAALSVAGSFMISGEIAASMLRAIRPKAASLERL